MADQMKTILVIEDIDDLIMGCVLPAGMGQAPASQAAIGANIPVSTGATTINKMCGSGMRSAMINGPAPKFVAHCSAALNALGTAYAICFGGPSLNMY